MYIYGYIVIFFFYILRDLYVIYIEIILVKLNYFKYKKNEILILSFVNWRLKIVYVVVEFFDDNLVVVVLNNWIIEDGKKCFWLSKFKVLKWIFVVKNVVVFLKEFVVLFVRVMYKGNICNKYLFLN